MQAFARGSGIADGPDSSPPTGSLSVRKVSILTEAANRLGFAEHQNESPTTAKRLKACENMEAGAFGKAITCVQKDVLLSEDMWRCTTAHTCSNDKASKRSADMQADNVLTATLSQHISL